MKKLILVIFSLFSVIANAQNSTWQWGVNLSSISNTDAGNSVTTDASENVYTTGSLNDHIFVQKLNGLTHSQIHFYEVSTVGIENSGKSIYYSAGFIYVTGGFKGTNIDFHNGWVLSSGWPGLTDIFILKLDTSLNIIWAKSFKSDANGTGNSYGYSIVVVTGSIYTTGCFRGGSLVDFDPGNGNYNLVNGGIFISKLDQFGNFSWAGKITGSSSGTSVGQSLAVANGFVYYTGKFYGTNIDFNPNSGTDLYTAGGSGSIFVLKLDTNGIYSNTWSGGVGGTGYGIAIENNFIYVTGLWPSSITGDIFILKLDYYLNPPIWVNHFGTINSSYGGAGKSISVVNNIIYTLGSFTDSVTFGGVTLYSSGASDVFVSKLHTDSSYIWAGSIGGVGGEGGSSLSVDPTHQNIYIVGNYASSFIIGSSTLPAPNGTDIFTAKLSCTPTPVSITPPGPLTFCAGNTVILTASSSQTYHWSNNMTSQAIPASATGSYSVTATDNYGCSSSSSSVTVTVNSNPTVSGFSDSSFCAGTPANITVLTTNGNGFLWSNGSTINQIVIDTAGIYSVTVTNNNNCTAVSSIVIIENPLPTTSTLTAGGPTTFCQGESVLLSGNNNNGTWNIGGTDTTLTVVSTGDYFVINSTPSCGSDTSNVISVIVNLIPTPIITQIGSDTLVVSSTNGDSYLWSTGATTEQITPDSSGTYSVTVTNSGGCSAAYPFYFTAVGIQDIQNSTNILAFPNPFASNFIVHSEGVYELIVYDMVGRVLSDTREVDNATVEAGGSVVVCVKTGVTVKYFKLVKTN